MSDRSRLGALGEQIAEWFLIDHGMEVVGRNVQIPGGELDLLAVDDSQHVAVEVRTRTRGDDPIDAIGPSKRRHVDQLAGSIGSTRTDYVGVRLSPRSVDIHWVPGV